MQWCRAIFAIAVVTMTNVAPISIWVSDASASRHSGTIERLLPSVVQITTHALANAAERTNDQAGYGSGFIIDPSGYIITNQHVVQDAYQIVVTLWDGSVYHAKLLGSGGDLDIAVLKIDVHHTLQSMTFGDSNALKIGDDVLAIGNPYGVGTTVTKGIISAVNRDLNRSIFDSYIQTDAAINRGNSGGPLVNTSGDVVGVNTAYYKGPAENGGFIGLGFAVPSAVAKAAFDLIRQFGYLRVGWLGVDGQTLAPEMATALGIEHKTGAILVDVKSEGPSVGKLEASDIVTEIDGESLVDVRMLQRIAAVSIDKPLRLKVLRKGEERIVVVSPSVRGDARASRGQDQSSSTSAVNDKLFGLSLDFLTDIERTKRGFSNDVTGVLVTSVASVSAAAEADLAPGDLIESIQLRPVRNPDEVVAVLGALRQEGEKFAVLRVKSGSRIRFVTLHLIWEGPNRARRHE